MKRILVIFLILIGVYVLFNSNIMNLFSFGKSEAEEKVTKNIDSVEIDASSIKTVILPEKRSDIHAELEGKGEVSVNKSGNSIQVKYKRAFFEGFSFFNKNTVLNIYIPEDFDRRMNINVGSGYLIFEGKSASKPMNLKELDINLGSGKIDLKNLNIGEFRNDVSSGMVTIHSLKTKEGTIDVNSGIVKIRSYEGKLKADISSGQLDVQMDKITDDIDAEVSSGHLKLDLPEDADFTLKGKVSSGLIKSDIPLKDKIQDKNKISGQSGTGKYQVKVSVSSGLVNIH
ncbi:DUF4097 family beta strand repeat-containing protein [Bacillus sp. S/N-304-OC-R1]|uniref:LiaG family protein n=1 Tax=Bacillus sp. S/N-304-OC-R1 TaxID=2758034 RepID=UPI001C8E88A7|nr:DUF4097 family beta strand repeat-containing protein [Bacillus sp. S/N-304-OC-R1]MBY0123672.1 DUF4097 family beta strand repeat protein [Bacillus sp. S/N-304-OC-R1]